MNLNRFTAPLYDLDTFHVFSDFWEDQADTVFIDTVTDSGSVAVGDSVAGIAVLTPSDGSVADNDEAYLATPNELFKYAAGKPIYGRCRLQFTEANTDDANVGFFFQNAVGADSILDNGGGLKVSGSTLGIYKVDGGTVWRCVSSCNGTSTDTISTKTAGGSSYQVLEIICGDWDGVSMQVSFRVDGEYLKDSNGNLIRHTVAIANATEMQVGVGVKNGDTNLETLNVDYLYAAQKR